MPESRVYGLFASLSARTGVACEPPVERKRPFSNGLKEVGLGLYVIEDPMHVKDIHASILWLLGLDNMQLTCDHKGRLERPTINEGSFHPALLSG